MLFLDFITFQDLLESRTGDSARILLDIPAINNYVLPLFSLADLFQVHNSRVWVWVLMVRVRVQVWVLSCQVCIMSTRVLLHIPEARVDVLIYVILLIQNFHWAVDSSFFAIFCNVLICNTVESFLILFAIRHGWRVMNHSRVIKKKKTLILKLECWQSRTGKV